MSDALKSQTSVTGVHLERHVPVSAGSPPPHLGQCEPTGEVVTGDGHRLTEESSPGSEAVAPEHLAHSETKATVGSWR